MRSRAVLNETARIPPVRPSLAWTVLCQAANLTEEQTERGRRRERQEERETDTCAPPVTISEDQQLQRHDDRRIASTQRPA